MDAVPEISAEELVAAAEEGRDWDLLDVRAPVRLESGRIDVFPDAGFHNIRGSELLSADDPSRLGLDPEKPLVVVCGLGNDSRRIAAHLNEAGFDARSLRGGMTAWMNATVRREIPPPPELDRFFQLDRIGKGALGYLLVSDGDAFAVDVPRRYEACSNLLRETGARLVGVADTHAHADYISGGPALARDAGVPYLLHPADAVSPYDSREAALDYTPLEDGQRLPVGRAEVAVVHTPGHTEGSVSFRLGDAAVLTGDFIFVGSVGRPDLGGKSREWTQVLFESLERAKRDWPGCLEMLPAHYTGVAERREDGVVGGNFAALCLRNEPLSLGDSDQFAAWVAARSRPFPEQYRRIKTINLGLEDVDDVEAEKLEVGRNECALG